MEKCGRHIDIRTLKAVSLASLIILVFSGHICAGTSEPDNWHQIHTKNTILCFQRLDDVPRLYARIDHDPDSQKSEKEVDLHHFSNMAPTLANKIDTLFERSQELLEMEGFTNKIRVKVFNDRQHFNHAFFRLYKKECTVRAWYTHEQLTVYIHLDDIHEGMLAHEFAHAIMNHYMIVPLPGKTAEILARYVDTHVHADEPDKTDTSIVDGYSIK